MNLLGLFILFFNLFITEITAKKRKHHHHKNNNIQIVPSLSVNVPLIDNAAASCPCAAGAGAGTSGPCRPSIFIDYYYNAPYTGYPANSSYLPPSDSIPPIIDRLTSIRNSVRNFVQSVSREQDDIRQALYIKKNYGNVHYLLKAISEASNKVDK